MGNNINIYRLFIITLFTVSLIMFSGCSEDDNGVSPENTSETLVGTWKFKAATMYDTPVGDLTFSADAMLSQSGTGAVSSVVQLNEDGTAATTTKYDDGTEETVEGTWTSEGDQITVEGAGLDDTFTYRFSSGDLIITMIMPIDFAQDGNLIDIRVDMVYERI